MLISRGERVFHKINVVFLLVLSLTVIYPFVNIFAISLNDGRDAMMGGIYLWPRKFSLIAYRTIFSEANLVHSAYISVLRTVIGTLSGLACTAVVAYVLSKKDLVCRRTIIFLYVVTMYVSGGIVPEYLLIRQLGMYNNFSVYVVPGLVTAMNVMMMRQFFEELPQSLLESARIDGASELRVLIQIVMPMATPVLATIALFIAVGHWTYWFDTYFYTKNDHKLSTLQGVLVKILMQAQAQQMGADTSSLQEFIKNEKKATPEVIKMATITITTVPILIVYPFLQKYFVGGITLGAVKE
jgi:putative aldouronate transport system permease protein